MVVANILYNKKTKCMYKYIKFVGKFTGMTTLTNDIYIKDVQII